MGKAPIVKKVGAPDWIVTFTDLTSLLTTFFVLLLTFSTMDPSEQAKFKGNEEGTPSPHGKLMCLLAEKYWVPSDTPPEVISGDTTVNIRNDAPSDSHEAGLPYYPGALEKGMRFSPQGREYSYVAGETKPTPAMKERAVSFAKRLQSSDLNVIVEGHTDNQFHGNKDLRRALDLSLERARKVARIFIDHGWSSDRIIVRGCGASRSRQPNKFRDGQRANRRVELIFQGRN